MEEALRAGVIRVVHTSSAGAVGPAQPGGTADESAAVHRRPPRDRLHQLQARRRDRRAARRRPGPAGRDRQPDLRPRPRRPDRAPRTGSSAGCCCAGIPAYIDGGLNIVDVRDVARGHLLADERGRGGRALPARRAQLHPPAPLRRPQPDRRGAAAALKLHGQVLLRASVEALERAGLPGAGHPRRGPLGDAVVDLPQRQGGHASSASSRARTRRPSRTRSRWQLEQLGARANGHPLTDAALRGAGAAAARLVPSRAGSR